jgi:putative membrane protein
MNPLATLSPYADYGRDHAHGWWPLWLVLWAALLIAAAWLVSRRVGRRSDPLERARAVLAERYASGELTGQEYRERLDELERASR